MVYMLSQYNIFMKLIQCIVSCESPQTLKMYELWTFHFGFRWAIRCIMYVYSLKYSICTFLFCIGKCLLITETERKWNDEWRCDEAMNISKNNTQWEMVNGEGCKASLTTITIRNGVEHLSKMFVKHIFAFAIKLFGIQCFQNWGKNSNQRPIYSWCENNIFRYKFHLLFHSMKLKRFQREYWIYRATQILF